MYPAVIILIVAHRRSVVDSTLELSGVSAPLGEQIELKNIKFDAGTHISFAHPSPNVQNFGAMSGTQSTASTAFPKMLTSVSEQDVRGDQAV